VSLCPQVLLLGIMSQKNIAGVPKGAVVEAPPLCAQIIRNLSDKLYEKRKMGALELEQLIREAKEAKDTEKINTIINFITVQFALSASGNQRKGGLIALAAAAIGLGTETWRYLNKLVPPVLRCFSDQDGRVRYYACEALYNISKVARGRILNSFNEIFEGLCRLSADKDLNVKNGAQLLDRLIKDIVTESDSFDIERFIPLLKERIHVTNAFVRSFLIGWITVLDSVPDIELLEYLPEFLDGLFKMLSDNELDIRTQADNLLAEFLKEIRCAPHVEFGRMVNILIPFATSQDEFTQLTTLKWVNEFILCGEEELLPYAADLVGSILPSISHSVQDIQTQASTANASLLRLMTNTKQEFAIPEFLGRITDEFKTGSVPTRLAALRWVLMLHSKTPEKLAPFLDTLYPALLRMLSDSADEVVRLDLKVLAKLSSQSESAYFDKLMHNLVSLFYSDQQLLESRGCLVIRQLSYHINPEKIYRALASILQDQQDPQFASLMVQTLNIILLTSAELYDLRLHLRDLSTPESRELFIILYHSWCHNAVATFSLCLLSQAYEHATHLINQFADIEVTVSLLMEIDKLVQLIESPVFTSLRLQLLEPEQNGHLYKCLFGLLMLLPQSAAFNILKNRLSCVSSLSMLQLLPRGVSVDESAAKERIVQEDEGIDFKEMLNHFVKIQRQHQDYRRKAYKEALCSNEGEELTDLIKNLPTLSRAQGTPAPQKTYEAKKKPIPAVPATLTQLFQRGRND
jgi:vacuole morphology and inheritance protein 14